MRTRLALVLLLSFPLAQGCVDEPAVAQSAPPPIAIELAPVDRSPVRETLVVPGLLHPRDTYELGFPLGGVVRAVEVEEGDEVAAGDVLARLDPTTQRAAVTQAREGLARAERDLLRARALNEGGSLSVAMYEDAQTGTNVARASVAAASFALRHAALRAPASGWIDARLVDADEVVGPGQPLFRIASMERGWVLRVAVPDLVVARIAVGDTTAVTLDARPEQALRATVVEIARLPAPGFGTFDVELHLEEPPRDLTLRTGLVGRAALAHGPPFAASVPVVALVDGHDHDAYVFTVEDGRARRVPVRVAFLSGDRAIVARGLDGVGEVVTVGADRLEDGAAVRPR